MSEVVAHTLYKVNCNELISDKRRDLTTEVLPSLVKVRHTVTCESSVVSLTVCFP